MATARFEVRLDREQYERLMSVAERRGATASAVVGQLINHAYDDVRRRRLEAARRLGELEVEDVPDPETINRQSESTYGVEPLP